MFNSKNKDVQQYLTQKALDLCDMGFDAIRLDHATGPCYAFWKYFVRTIKAKSTSKNCSLRMYAALFICDEQYETHIHEQELQIEQFTNETQELKKSMECGGS